MDASTVLPRIDATQFREPPAPLFLARDEIHLWYATAAKVMAPERVAAMLQRLLAGYAGVEAVRIERDQHGKPWLANCPQLHFNISHSGPAALLAFAWNQPLGVDVEQGARVRSPMRLAHRFFHPDEAAQLGALPRERQHRGFLSLWTGKEAVLKAIGRGLPYGLDRIILGISANAQLDGVPRIAGTPANWQLVAIDLEPPLVGALAWNGAPAVVRTFRFPDCGQV